MPEALSQLSLITAVLTEATAPFLNALDTLNQQQRQQQQRQEQEKKKQQGPGKQPLVLKAPFSSGYSQQTQQAQVCVCVFVLAFISKSAIHSWRLI